MSGNLRLNGGTSGYSELRAPDDAGDQVFLFPLTGGTLMTTNDIVSPDGLWTRTGTTISPSNPGDDLDGIGTITAGGDVNVNNGTQVHLSRPDGTQTQFVLASEMALDIRSGTNNVAGRKFSISGEGNVTSTGTLTATRGNFGDTYVSGDGVNCFSGGSIYIRQDGASSNASLLTILNGGTEASNRKVVVYGDGSATFADKVQVSALTVYDGSSNTVVLNTNGSSTFAGRITTSSDMYIPSATGNNGLAIYNSSGSSSSNFAVAIADNDGGSPKSITLSYDGNITAAGAIQSGGTPYSGANVGSVIEDGGIVGCKSGNGSLIWAGYLEGTSNPTSTIEASGQSFFRNLMEVGTTSAPTPDYCFIGHSSKDSTSDYATFYARNMNASGRTFTGADSSGASTFEVFGNGNGIFAGSVQASNITSFKSALTAAVTASTDHATLKAAILSALANL